MAKVRLPGPKDRIAVIGTTGSGKTVAALWHLSRADLRTRPWIIFDFKDDENIAQIEQAKHVGLDYRPNEKAEGIFVVRPYRDEEEEVNSMMEDLLERGNVGVYVDEPDMNRATGYEDLLRKGRSHYIPMIGLTQRPVDCNRYMLSEAGFFQVFDLADEQDWKRVRQFVPDANGENLEKYHSLYYDRDRKQLTRFAPVPEIETIMENIDAQLTPEERKRVFV